MAEWLNTPLLTGESAAFVWGIFAGIMIGMVLTLITLAIVERR